MVENIFLNCARSRNPVGRWSTYSTYHKQDIIYYFQHSKKNCVRALFLSCSHFNNFATILPPFPPGLVGLQTSKILMFFFVLIQVHCNAKECDQGRKMCNVNANVNEVLIIMNCAIPICTSQNPQSVLENLSKMFCKLLSRLF